MLIAAISAPSATHAGGGADAILSQEIQWPSVIAQALRHRLVPALRSLLEASDPRLVPADLLDALRQHDAKLREHSAALIRELFDILEALKASAVPAVVFKGPLLGELLFGDYGLRSPGDIDILVQPEAVPSVCDLLAARGYIDAGRGHRAQRLTPSQERMYLRYHCEYTWIRESDEVVVEPHWALSQRSLAADVNYAGMLSRARLLTLCGQSVSVLAPDDLLLALCIHGTKHRWQRLGWIRDVAALVRTMDPSQLDGCVRQARSVGCLRLLLVGLALAARFGGAPLPHRVEQLLDADTAARPLASAVGATLFGPARMIRNDRFESFRYNVRERWSDRLRYVMRTYLAPGRTHLELVALPDRARWVYFPLRWALDFAVMPAWGMVPSKMRAAIQGWRPPPTVRSGAAVRTTEERPHTFRVSTSHTG